MYLPFFPEADRSNEDNSSHHRRNSGIKNSDQKVAERCVAAVVCSFSRSLVFPQLQINYDRNLGNLIVHVLQARNLAQRDNDGYSDPFVKVYLLPGRG